MKSFDEWFEENNNGEYISAHDVWQAAQEVQRESFENDINLAFIKCVW